MKICTKCKIETPKSMMIQGGEGSWCKQCSKEYTQRFRGTERGKAYSTYYGMLNRCYEPSSTRYSKYGGAGVTVCTKWLGDKGFDNFFIWYQMQPNSSNDSYQIDKDVICNSKGIKPHYYSPETCQYVSRSENQRNYSSLLVNNTSGYTGVTLNKNGITWDFRLHREYAGNINRSGFLSALEAAKSREACIIVNDLDFKLEYVGSSMDLSEAPSEPYSLYGSSNYSMVRRTNSGKYTGTIKLLDGTRKSIGQHSTEYLASKAYTTMATQLGVQKINKPSILFGFGPITKEV